MYIFKKKIFHTIFVVVLFAVLSLIVPKQQYALSAGNFASTPTTAPISAPSVSCSCSNGNPIGASYSCTSSSGILMSYGSCNPYEECYVSSNGQSQSIACSPVTCSCNNDGVHYTCSKTAYGVNYNSLPAVCGSGYTCPASSIGVLGNPCISSTNSTQGNTSSICYCQPNNTYYCVDPSTNATSNPLSCAFRDTCPTGYNKFGYPCISAGSVVSPTPAINAQGTPNPTPKPALNALGTPIPTPPATDPCSGAYCGNGYYCGGRCGASGLSGTLYHCTNNKMDQNPNNCGCQYCDIGPDYCPVSGVASTCASTSNFSACENSGGTCFPNNVTPTPDIPNVTITALQLACVDSQGNTKQNTACWGTTNSLYNKPCTGSDATQIGQCKPDVPPGCPGSMVKVSSGGTECNQTGGSTNYICCIAAPGYGYTPQTACANSFSSGICEKGNTCGKNETDVTKLGAPLTYASCAGSPGISPNDFSANSNSNLLCCVPNGNSSPAGHITYVCSSDKTDVVVNNAGIPQVSCSNCKGINGYNVGKNTCNIGVCDENSSSITPGVAESLCVSATPTPNNISTPAASGTLTPTVTVTITPTVTTTPGSSTPTPTSSNVHCSGVCYNHSSTNATCDQTSTYLNYDPNGDADCMNRPGGGVNSICCVVGSLTSTPTPTSPTASLIAYGINQTSAPVLKSDSVDCSNSSNGNYSCAILLKNNASNDVAIQGNSTINAKFYYHQSSSAIVPNTILSNSNVQIIISNLACGNQGLITFSDKSNPLNLVSLDWSCDWVCGIDGGFAKNNSNNSSENNFYPLDRSPGGYNPNAQQYCAPDEYCSNSLGTSKFPCAKASCKCSSNLNFTCTSNVSGANTYSGQCSGRNKCTSSGQTLGFPC